MDSGVAVAFIKLFFFSDFREALCRGTCGGHTPPAPPGVDLGRSKQRLTKTKIAHQGVAIIDKACHTAPLAPPCSKSVNYLMLGTLGKGQST